MSPANARGRERSDKPPRRSESDEASTRPSREEFSKVRIRFDSDGTECVGSLYRPDRPRDAPVVVMAPAFGMERTFGYEQFAERFAEAGYAVLLFDYRNFGDSEGEPRNLVSPAEQVADYREAVASVRDFDGVDSKRIVLWGHSLAGGHAVSVAAEDNRVAAVVAVAPLLDGRAAALAKGVKFLPKAVLAGLRDKLQSVVTGPHTIPVAGDPGEFAVLTESGTKRELFDLVPRGSTWENAVPARILLSLPFYRPVGSLGDVRCPTLFVSGTDDDVVSASSVESAAGEVRDARLVQLPSSHFGFYHGSTFEELVGHQLAFLDAAVR